MRSGDNSDGRCGGLAAHLPGARQRSDWVYLTDWRMVGSTFRAAARDEDLLDPVRGFELWRSTADRLQAWYDGGKEGPRPFGRILPRHMELSGALKARWVPPLCRLAIDPDGRMLRLQREGEL
jgi:hypothetical protein